MHISFLIHNAYGIGGTIRTTNNLAARLAEHHDVDIVSVFRHRAAPAIPPGAGVRLRHLVDLRDPDTPGSAGDAAHPDHGRPARAFPRADSRHRQYSLLTDHRIARHLADTGADVVVGTRPGLNVHLARDTGPGPVLVGQEHLTLDGHSRALRARLRAAYPALDALTTTTRADAHAYRTRLRLPGVRIEALPGSVPAPAVAPSDGTGRWVVAAGRLAPVKRFSVLIRAFDQVRARRPDWRLRIYGSGAQQRELRELIDRRGLYNHVFLMGAVSPMEPEWVKGSVAAVTSSAESFGMTIVEAMRCGLPVVATDCPHGPREIIDDGVDGLLVEVDSPDAVAAGLLTLINDDGLRLRMAAAARAHSARYDPALVAERCCDLFASLGAGRGAGRRPGPRRPLRRATAALYGGGLVVRGAARGLWKGPAR